MGKAGGCRTPVAHCSGSSVRPFGDTSSAFTTFTPFGPALHLWIYLRKWPKMYPTFKYEDIHYITMHAVKKLITKGERYRNANIWKDGKPGGFRHLVFEVPFTKNKTLSCDWEGVSSGRGSWPSPNPTACLPVSLSPSIPCGGPGSELTFMALPTLHQGGLPTLHLGSAFQGTEVGVSLRWCWGCTLELGLYDS